MTLSHWVQSTHIIQMRKQAQRSHGKWSHRNGRGSCPDILRWSDRGSCTQGLPPWPGLGAKGGKREGNGLGRSVPGRGCGLRAGGLRSEEGWKICTRQSETPPALTPLAGLLAASLAPLTGGVQACIPGCTGFLEPSCCLLGAGPTRLQWRCPQDGKRQVAGPLKAGWTFGSPLPARPWVRGLRRGPFASRGGYGRNVGPD